MKSIFVTGGAGYIGSHTCKRLASCGYQPVTYDNLSTGHREFVKWGPLVEGDLHDGAKIVDALQHYRPVAVIHFAASAYVGESVAYPFKYYWNNVSGTLSLLEAMQRTQVDRLVFSSSCATYGAPEAKLISEDCTLNPINPYGRSKLMLETVLRDLSSARRPDACEPPLFQCCGLRHGRRHRRMARAGAAPDPVGDPRGPRG